MTGSSRQESQAQKPLHKILTLYAGKRLYEVLVPFVCQCCARCCRQFGVDLSSLDNRRIADYFGSLNTPPISMSKNPKLFGKAFLLPFDLLVGLKHEKMFLRYFDKFAGTTVIDLRAN